MFWYAWLFMILWYMAAIWCLWRLTLHFCWWNKYHKAKLRGWRVAGLTAGIFAFTMLGVLCCVGGRY